MNMEEKDFELLLKDIYGIIKKHYENYKNDVWVFIPDEEWVEVNKDVYLKFNQHSLEFHLEKDQGFFIRRMGIVDSEKSNYNKRLEYSKGNKRVSFLSDGVQKKFKNVNELLHFIDNEIKEFIDKSKD